MSSERFRCQTKRTGDTQKPKSVEMHPSHMSFCEAFTRTNNPAEIESVRLELSNCKGTSANEIRSNSLWVKSHRIQVKLKTVACITVTGGWSKRTRSNSDAVSLTIRIVANFVRRQLFSQSCSFYCAFSFLVRSRTFCLASSIFWCTNLHTWPRWALIRAPKLSNCGWNCS